MLPSSGYFRSVICPFFESGLCERPHCHFRHVKKDGANTSRPRSNVAEDGEVSGLSNVESKPDLLRLVREAVRKMKEEVEQEHFTPLHSSVPNHSLVSSSFVKGFDVESEKKILNFPYNDMPSAKDSFATPVDKTIEYNVEKPFSTDKKPNKYLSYSEINVENKKSENKSGAPVIEYKPTPIAQLKKMQQENKYMKATTKVTDEMEYDPVSNYSAGILKKDKVLSYDPSLVKSNLKRGISENNNHVVKKVKFCLDDLDAEVETPMESASDTEAKFSDDENDTHHKQINIDKLLKESSETFEKLDPSPTATNKFDLVDKILSESKKSEEAIINQSKKPVPSNNVVTEEKNSEKINKKVTSEISNEKKLAESTSKVCERLIDTDLEPSEVANVNNTSNKVKTVVNTVDKDYAKKEQKIVEHKDKPVDIKNEKDIKNDTKLVKKDKKLDNDKSGKSHVKSKEHSSNKKEAGSHSSGKSDKKPETVKKSHSDKKKQETSSSQKKSSHKSSTSQPHSSKSSKKEHSKHEKLKSSHKKSSESSKDLKKSSSKHKDKNDKEHRLKERSKKTSSHDSKNTKKSESINNKINNKISNSNKINKDRSSGNHHLSKEKNKIFTQPNETKSPIKVKEQSKIVNNSSSPIIDSSDTDNSDIENYSDMALPNFDDLDTDLDEHDTYEECLRIFNEYVPSEEPKTDASKQKPSKIKKNHLEDEEYSHLKRRVAHAGTSADKMAQSRASSMKTPLPAKSSPAQVMFGRYAQLQKMIEQQPHVSQSSAPSSAFLSTVSSNVNKKRIAHVPNVSALINATNSIKSKMSSPPDSMQSYNSVTKSQTNPKGNHRMAHIPQHLSSPRPMIAVEYGSKVPSNVRQRYLNLIIDECLKIYDNEQDAYDRALEEEKNSYERSSSRTVYLNVVINTIKRLRSELAGIIPIGTISKKNEISSPPPTPPSPISSPPKSYSNTSSTVSNSKTVSHEYVLGGKKAANISYSIERVKKSKPSEEISGKLLYKILENYILTEKQLEENGYPRPHPLESGKAYIHQQEHKKNLNTLLERVCCRCGARFKVSSKGTYITKEECVYHWGRAYKRRIAGSIENRYGCCQGDLQSEGCCVAKLHVSENIDYNNLTGYVTTLPKTPPIDGNYKVYALDCEMCYTVNGNELTRVTVIGPNLKPVYETLVLPESPIIDYNTRFSGITEEDMRGVTTNIRDVQAVLLSKFNSKTILIGHSLESDFRALKLIHDTVVDTAIVFPHRLGPPYKRALKNLMAEYLKKIIQNSVDGHDSQEDAVACMELMMYKIKEDYKKMMR